jgi:ubiquinone/menaquinone biosynthesis C-methylase UbiE
MKKAALGAIAVFVVFLSIICLATSDASDAARLVDALRVRPGMSVAEIGAGDGELTVAVAKVVGPTGRFFSTELDKNRMEKIKRATESMPQVSVIEAHVAATNLPEGCCDAIFMRDVYHHFTDAAAMNRSLMKSLKPGGLLAIYDFPPRTGREADPKERGGSVHGITFKTLEAELKEAGFTHISTQDHVSGRNYLVVVQRAER